MTHPLIYSTIMPPYFFDYRIVLHELREPCWCLKRGPISADGDFMFEMAIDLELAGSKEQLAARVERMRQALDAAPIIRFTSHRR